DGALGCGVHPQRKGGNPLRYHLFESVGTEAAHLHRDHRRRADFSVWNLAAGFLRLCELHESGAVGLFARADQLDVFRLRHFRRGLHLSLLLARVSGRPRREIARDRPVAVERLTMPLSPFSLCIIAIVLLGALGLPIGHSMIVASILYLLLSGLDLGTAAEQILNGLFNSYVLLAIPLFILAADLMNIGSLT